VNLLLLNISSGSFKLNLFEELVSRLNFYKNVISFNLLQNSYIILNSLINCCETLYLFDLWS
jgi:hypothetical protein